MTITSLVLLFSACLNQVPQNAPNEPVAAQTEATALGFPSPDDSCEEDEDCGTFHRTLEDDGRCCYTCEHQIASTSWVQAAMAVCETRSREGCAMFKCAAPPKLKCKQGRCAAK